MNKEIEDILNELDHSGGQTLMHYSKVLREYLEQLQKNEQEMLTMIYYNVDPCGINDNDPYSQIWLRAAKQECPSLYKGDDDNE